MTRSPIELSCPVQWTAKNRGQSEIIWYMSFLWPKYHFYAQSNFLSDSQGFFELKRANQSSSDQKSDTQARRLSDRKRKRELWFFRKKKWQSLFYSILLNLKKRMAVPIFDKLLKSSTIWCARKTIVFKKKRK